MLFTMKPLPVSIFVKATPVLVGLALFCGCSKRSAPNPLKPVMDSMRHEESLTAGYLQGDAAQARKSLDQLIQFYQDPKTKLLTPDARAKASYETYSRLFALEKRTGNEAEAEAALAKMREWRQRFFQLVNAPDQDGATLTPERVQALADEMDKAQNHGQPPHYVQTLAK
jgi:hypothetical protein